MQLWSSLRLWSKIACFGTSDNLYLIVCYSRWFRDANNKHAHRMHQVSSDFVYQHQFYRAMPSDPFADALNADDDSDLDSEATLAMNGAAPSLDASDEEHVKDVVDLCEEDEHTAKLAESSKPKGTRPTAFRKRKLSSSKASGSQPIGAKKSKRDYNPDVSHKLTVVKHTNGDDIKCVFLPRTKGGQEAIPLLPRFDAAWDKVDFGDRTWIVVSSTARWLQLLVRLHIETNPTHSVRAATQHLCAVVKTEFDTCLHKQRCLVRAKATLEKEKKARRPQGLKSDGAAGDDESSSGNEDDSQETVVEKAKEVDGHQFRAGRKEIRPCLALDIGGYTVTCINTKKRFIIAVDSRVVSFIEMWLMPLAQDSARILALEKSGTPSASNASASKEQGDSQTSDAPSGYSFTQNMTPNIKDKVSWLPSRHLFKVKAQKKAKGRVCHDTFVVDGDLQGEEYLTMKAEKYHEAVTEWNDSDKSTRHRIAIPSNVLEYIRQQGHRTIHRSGGPFTGQEEQVT